MNIKIVPVNRTYAVIVNDTHWRRFHHKRDAEQLKHDLQTYPETFKYDLDPMRQKARCNACGTDFTFIPGLLNSTYGSYPDFNEWPKCPTCKSYIETHILEK